MLVLTREINEDIVLTYKDGTEARIKVVRVDGRRVRLGVDAPVDVVVMRGELLKEAK